MAAFFFGKKKAAAAPTPTVSVVDQISAMDVKIQQYEKQVAHCDQQIRSLKVEAMARQKAKDVERARMIMKQILRLKQERTKYMNWQDTLQDQKGMLVAMDKNKDFVQAMQGATAALKAGAEIVNPDVVDTLREEHDEAVSKLEEVNDALAGGWVHGGPGEDELDSALAELGAEMAEDGMADVSAVPAYAAPVAYGAPAPAYATGAAAAAVSTTAPLPDFPMAPVGAVSIPAAATAAPAGNITDMLAAMEANM